MNQGGEQIAGSNDASGGISSYVTTGIIRTSEFPLGVAGGLLTAGSVGDGADQLALGVSDLLGSHEMSFGCWESVDVGYLYYRICLPSFLLKRGDCAYRLIK